MHGNIKGANILVTEDGGRVRLADVGIWAEKLWKRQKERMGEQLSGRWTILGISLHARLDEVAAQR